MAVVAPLVGGLVGAGIAGALFPSVALAPAVGYFVGSMLASLLFPGSIPTGKPPKKASISDVQFNKANEGDPLPLVYGTCRVTPNIIWFGNLKTTKIKRKVSSGKKKKKVTVGYRYYIDVWFGICDGTCDIIEAYLGDKKIEDPDEVANEYWLWNEKPPESAFSDKHKPYVNGLPGMTHCFVKELYMGANTTYIPTIQFVVKRILADDVPFQWDLDEDGPDGYVNYGANPAAVIYDLLVNQAGINPVYIDVTSFGEAAAYYASKKWGINLQVTSDTPIGDLVERVAGWVDSLLVTTQDGKIGLKVLRDDDEEVATIDNDFKEFNLTKPSWTTVPSTFKAEYTDPDAHYTVRGVGLRNIANVKMTGQDKLMTVDLSAFPQRDVVFSRLHDAMKRYSYPMATLEAVVPLRWAWLSPGDVIRVKEDTYHVDGVFRVLDVEIRDFSKNEVRLSLRQHTGELFDNFYTAPIGSKEEPIDLTLKPFRKVAVYELPYIPGGDRTRQFLLLVNRETGWEVGYNVYISYDGLSYGFLGNFTDFSQYGVLADALPHTRAVWDEPVEYLPYKELEYFPQVSRDDVWATSRGALVGEELMLFAEHNPTADGYELKYVRRGILWTERASHPAGTPVWVFPFEDNVVEIQGDEFWLKFTPTSLDGEGDISEALAVHVTPTGKVFIPQPVGYVEAVRSGEDVQVRVHPVTYLYAGAGYHPASTYTDSWPPEFEGVIMAKVGDGGYETVGAEFEVSRSGSFTLYVKHIVDGRESSEVMLEVGAADGKYHT